MKQTWHKVKEGLRKTFMGGNYAEPTEMDQSDNDYVELDTSSNEEMNFKVFVQPFVVEDFAGIKEVLDKLRDGKTIALVNIRPLKEKDLIELKRCVDKLKKTCDAVEGDIAGFGEDWIVATPSFAKIIRSKAMKGVAAQKEME